MKLRDDGGPRRKKHEGTKRKRNSNSKVASARLRQLRKQRGVTIKKLKG